MDETCGGRDELEDAVEGSADGADELDEAPDDIGCMSFGTITGNGKSGRSALRPSRRPLQ